MSRCPRTRKEIKDDVLVRVVHSKSDHASHESGRLRGIELARAVGKQIKKLLFCSVIVPRFLSDPNSLGNYATDFR
jgi:hypothetical protein